METASPATHGNKRAPQIHCRSRRERCTPGSTKAGIEIIDVQRQAVFAGHWGQRFRRLVFDVLTEIPLVEHVIATDFRVGIEWPAAKTQGICIAFGKGACNEFVPNGNFYSIAGYSAATNVTRGDHEEGGGFVELAGLSVWLVSVVKGEGEAPSIPLVLLARWHQ